MLGIKLESHSIVKFLLMRERVELRIRWNDGDMSYILEILN